MQYCDLWVMEPGAMRQMQALAATITPKSLELAYQALENVRETGAQHRREKSIAVVPVHGPLEARPTLMGQFLGMSSYEAIGNAVARLAADDTVSAIVMDYMTPGGMVYGCPECAAKIRAAAEIKPVIGVSNPMAASGGYWLISASSRVVGSVSSDFGSVGVIVSRFDSTAAMEQEGVKEHVFRSTASPYKGEMGDGEPLTDDGRLHIQQRVDAIYDQFAGDLARFRGVSVEHVREHFGKGRLVDSRAAVKAGMVDRVMTLEETVFKLAAGRIRIAGAAAQDDWNAPTPHEERTLRIREKAGSVRAIAEVN